MVDSLLYDVIGFGSLNLDEFWEVTSGFFHRHDLRPGREYVMSGEWLARADTELAEAGALKARDPGGSAANMIAALHRMGFRTGFFGAVGASDAHRMRLNELGRPEDMHVIRVNRSSGRCLALLDIDDPGRDRALIIVPNANNEVTLRNDDLVYFSRSRWAHFTSFVPEGPLEAQMEIARRAPASLSISFDPGAVYVARGMDVLRPILERCSILFVTEEELSELTRRPEIDNGIAEILDIGTRMIVLKKGDRGISAYGRDIIRHQEGVPVQTVVDRTGAGDVAAAGFLAGALCGWTTERSLLFAAAAAARSIQGYGRAAYPDREFFDLFAGKA
jgi:ribokinase